MDSKIPSNSNITQTINSAIQNLKEMADATNLIVGTFSKTLVAIPDDLAVKADAYKKVAPIIYSYLDSIGQIIKPLSLDFDGKDINTSLAIQNLKEIADATKTIIGTFSKTLGAMPDDFAKNANTYKNVVPAIHSYLDSIGQAMKILSLEFDGKDINKLLGYVEAKYDKRGQVIEKAKYVSLEAISKISEVITSITTSIDTIAKMDVGLNNYFKIQTNLFIMRSAMNQLLKSVFTSLQLDESQKSLLPLLIGTSEVINRNINTEESSTNVGGKETSSLSSNTKEQIVGARQGIMHVLLQAIEIVKSFNDLKFPNFIRFFIKKKIFERRFKKVTDSVFKSIENLVGNDPEKTIKSMEGQSKAIEAINDSLVNISLLIESFKKLHVDIITYKLAIKTFGSYDKDGKFKDGWLGNIFKSMYLFITSPYVEKMADKTKFKNIQQAASNINSIKLITDSVKSIILNMMILGALAIPFITMSPLIVLAWITLMGVLWIINKTSIIMGNKVLHELLNVSVKRISINLLLILGVILGASLVLVAMALMAPIILKSMKPILGSLLVIIIIMLAAVALGALVGLLAPLLVATKLAILSIGLILLSISIIAVMLIGIKQLDITSHKQEILNSVSSIVSTIKDVINEVFGIFDDPMGSNEYGDDGLLNTLGSWIFGDMFINMIKLISASMILVFGTLSIGAIYLAAYTLNWFIDDHVVNRVVKEGGPNGKIVSNASTIIGTAKSVVNAIFDNFDDPMGDANDGDLLSIAGSLLGDMFVNTIKLIMSCVVLTFTVIAVGLVRLTASSLDLITNVNIDSGKIKENASTIIGTAKSIIAAVNAPTEAIKESDGDKSFGREIVEWALPSGLVNMLDAIMAIGSIAPTMLAVGSIGFMAKTINSISEVSVNDNVEKNAQDIILLGSRLVNLINDQDSFGLIDSAKALKRISVLKELGDVLNNFSKDVKVGEHEKLVNNTIKFVDTINNVKLENLQTTHKLFKEMKEFSESISGNFEGLANALNEKIAPLLEELKEMIGKIPESVKDSATTISGSVYTTAALQGGTATSSGLEEQIMRENPSMSKEDVTKMVDERMTQQSQSIYKGMEMKMEEILDVLQNYSNPIPVRMS